MEFTYCPPYRNKSFLQQKYLVERLSSSQIAVEIASSRSTVAAWLKKLGIPLRTEDEAHALNKGQLRYGEKRRNGQTSTHQRETQVIEKILDLRRQGHSYWKIADILTTILYRPKTVGVNGRPRR